MKVPTIHLNGTSKDRLLEAIEEAYLAITAAEEKLAETAPNGRDYYPQGPGAHGEAVIEHAERMAKLRSVKDELEEIVNQIMEATVLPWKEKP